MESLTAEIKQLGQAVLVLQGGGALGAYQAGMYQAFHEAELEPDWIIGTSIGAINAALIAGNPPNDRLNALKAFWKRVELAHFSYTPFLPSLNMALRNAFAITAGVPNFFRPNPAAFLSPHTSLGPEQAGYYSVEPLAETLRDLVDFKRINSGTLRLTVGACDVQTSEMRYFDSREEPLDARHILASGALPPAFPAVRIGDKLYWDGGILSNTPVEAVFDDPKRRNSVVFVVHLWNPRGPEPKTIWEVMNRQKDLQYSSRSTTHIKRQRQLHKLRHIIAELSKKLPQDLQANPQFCELAGYGCLTRMHVIRMVAPPLDNEDHTKDVDFSPEGIKSRWDAGYSHMRTILRRAPWREPFDPMEGLILHEVMDGEVSRTSIADPS